MSSFNEKLKLISLRDLSIFILLIFIIESLLASLNLFKFNSSLIYVSVICYFIFKLKSSFSSFRQDFLKVFTMQSLKDILTVVILNIFISYGLLYLSNFILGVYPALNSFVRSSVLVNNSLFAFYGFIMVVFISPVSEELIFRGVLLNRLNLLLPMAFSIVISSILFAFLHGFGSIISAFIFAICMAILYLKTDNILVPIFAHFLNNFIAESIVIIDVGKVLFTNHVVMLIMSILAIISAIVILIQIKEQWNILNINKL